jgi:hypothetical protein
LLLLGIFPLSFLFQIFGHEMNGMPRGFMKTTIMMGESAEKKKK